MGSAPFVSKLAKEMKLAMPRNKKWSNIKQRIIRFIPMLSFSSSEDDEGAYTT